MGRCCLYDETLGDLIGQNLDFVGFHEDFSGINPVGLCEKLGQNMVSRL